MKGTYFIANRSDNSVKIGFSDCIEKRIKQLSTGSSGKLILLGYIESEKELEKQLHRQFSQYRLRSNGEWFTIHESLVNFINENNNINVYIDILDNKLMIYKKMKK